MTKNSCASSPSRQSTRPTSTSRSSVAFASCLSSSFERSAKSGARPSDSALVSWEKITGEIYRSDAPLPSAAANARAAAARWLCSDFHSSPSSATVSASPVGDENRVVAEAPRAPLLPPRSRPRASRARPSPARRGRARPARRRSARAGPRRLASGGQELRHVRLVGRVLAGVARGEDAGRAVERGDLEARVLARDPGVRVAVLSSEGRLARAFATKESRRSPAAAGGRPSARPPSREARRRARAPCAGSQRRGRASSRRRRVEVRELRMRRSHDAAPPPSGSIPSRASTTSSSSRSCVNGSRSAVAWMSITRPDAGHDHVHVHVRGGVLHVVEVEEKLARPRCRARPPRSARRAR